MTQLADTLNVLKNIASNLEDKVEKTADSTPEDTPVSKADEPSDVMKSIAAVYKSTEDRFGEIERGIGEGFELVAKAVKGLQEQLAELPQGRKSVARRLPPAVGHDDVGKTATDDDVAKQIADAPDALSALKVLNKHTYGVE